MRRCARAGGLALAVVAACSVASPATEVKEALARTSRVELAAGAARVALAPVRFGDVVVSVDGPRALVLAMVDGEGEATLPGGEVALSYVGREALELQRCAGRRWCPAAPALPALAGVVAALAAEPRGAARPVAWQIRVERERAMVGEDAEAPDGARPARRRLELVKEGAAWRIASR